MGSILTMDLVQKVKDSIHSQNLLSRNEAVVVGVSGGPDSVALISILRALSCDLNLQLYVAHFNHRLRKESQQDEKFVKDLSHKLNLPFVRGDWRHPRIPKKGSLEELAREERLQFLMNAARSKKAKTIALGHQRDDLAETVLMRILRGTGLQGMRAILPKRNIQGFTFIRPLLGAGRKEIESYLKKNRLSFRVDATNKKTDFFRNKLRLKLLPLLEKEYQNNIREVLTNLSENITVDYDYLKNQAWALFSRLKKSTNSKTIQFNLKSFRKEHLALQRLLIRLSVESLKGDTNRLTLRHWKEIEALLISRPAGAIVDLPDQLYVQKTKSSLILRKT